jgi:hypothetical protein
MIYNSSAVPINNVALSLESGQNRIYTILIDCYSGHTLSAEIVGDVVIEARQGTAGAWTDIETTPISLTSYNGTRETFQFRVTSGTNTSHLVRSWRFRVGPAEAAVSGQIAFGSALVTFFNRPVTHLPSNLYFDGEAVTHRDNTVSFTT